MAVRFEVTTAWGVESIYKTLAHAQAVAKQLYSRIDYFGEQDEYGISLAYDRYCNPANVCVVAVDDGQNETKVPQTYWVTMTLQNNMKWIWKGRDGKPMEFISEVQADEMAEIWKAKYAGSSIPHSVVLARSVPLN